MYQELPEDKAPSTELVNTNQIQEPIPEGTKPLNQISSDYEAMRRKLRTGSFTTFAIFLKYTIGIGIFIIHYPLYKVGIILGLIFSILIGYATVYGILIVCKLCDEIDIKPTYNQNFLTAPAQFTDDQAQTEKN